MTTRSQKQTNKTFVHKNVPRPPVKTTGAGTKFEGSANQPQSSQEPAENQTKDASKSDVQASKPTHTKVNTRQKWTK